MWSRASGGDGLDFDAGVVLAVALGAAIGLPALELPDDELGPTSVGENLRDDRRPAQERLAELDLAGVGHEVHVLEGDGGAELGLEKRNFEHLVGLGVPLLACDRDD